jgi:sulfotransferase
MSGPVAGLMGALLGEMSGRNEYAVFIDDAQRRRVLAGLLYQYYGEEFPAEVIFDTSRVWCSRMRLLKELFPSGKVIACVRDVPWIIDSIERVVRQNTFQPSSIFNYQTGGTVYSRSEGLANGEGMVGYAYNALKEAYFGEDSANLMLLQYETLTRDPSRAIKAVYDFIEEPAFAHDFENIHYDADEFDRRAGTPGLHAVRRRIEPHQRDTILPPDLFRRFENDAFWRDPKLNVRHVAVI